LAVCSTEVTIRFNWEGKDFDGEENPEPHAMGHVEVGVGLWDAGKAGIVRVAISDVADRLLVGVATLETLGLTVDPLTGQLKESFYLMH
jgi:hypothetical protein